MASSLHSGQGVAMYSAQPTKGTGVTPATGFGICEYHATDDGDYKQFFTVGNYNLYANKPGIYRVDWQIRKAGLGFTQKALLIKCARASNILPWITLGLGSDDGTNKEAWQIIDNKVRTLELSMSGGGVLTAGITGIGGLKTAPTTLAITTGTESPMMSYEGVVTVGGTGVELKEFQVQVNHNLTVESRIRSALITGATTQRGWDYLTEGNLQVEGSIQIPRVYAKDFQAATQAVDGDLVLTLTDVASGVNTITITFTAAEFLRQVRDMPNQGYGNFTLPFNAKGFTVA